MKTYVKLAALFLAGVGAGALPSRLLGKGADADRLEFQNARLYVARLPLEDGGVLQDIRYEACGYLFKADAGRQYAEPCWSGVLDVKAFTAATEAMLAQYDGGR